MLGTRVLSISVFCDMVQRVCEFEEAREDKFKTSSGATVELSRLMNYYFEVI